MTANQNINDTNWNHRFDVQKIEKLTIPYWRSGGGGGVNLSIPEAKKKIVKLLAGMTFGVNAVPAHKDRIIDVAGRLVDLTHEVRNNGVVMALANAGSGSSTPGTPHGGFGGTFPIRNGAPLCFDMDTGYCVTGVNPDWHHTEYKLVGTAMGELEIGMRQIPMKFGQPSSGGGTVNRMAMLHQKLYKGKSTPAALLKPVNADDVENPSGSDVLQWGFDENIVVWDYLMPYEDDYIDQHVKVIVSQEPTTNLWVVNNPACSPGGLETESGISDSAPAG